jgi:hypothetical protein
MTLFKLALIVAVIARTVTQEEVFREFKEYCQRRSQSATSIAARKFFYLFTCQYCFSHWVSLGVVAVTGFSIGEGLLGHVFAIFALVGVANLYLASYERLTVSTREARVSIARAEAEAVAALPVNAKAASATAAAPDNGKYFLGKRMTACS